MAEDYSTPTPPTLSNSTRRIMSDREFVSQDAWEASTYYKEMKREEEERLRIDAQRSNLYNQEMERRVNEAAWYDREENRRQGSAALKRLANLNPSDPLYLQEKAKILQDLPRASLDTNVAGVFQAKDTIYEEAKKARDEARKINDELEKSKAATDYNVAAQAKVRDDSNRINDEREALKRVSAMPIEAREAFKSARAAGLDFWEAEAAANDVKAKNVAPQDYNSALRTNSTLRRENNTLRKQMEDAIAEMTKFDGPLDEERIRPYKEAIEENEKLIESNRAIYITPYDERQKAMRGEQGPKPGATEAATGGAANASKNKPTTPEEARDSKLAAAIAFVKNTPPNSPNAEKAAKIRKELEARGVNF